MPLLAQVRPEVAWTHERLSVRADGAELRDVVAELARVTGIEVSGIDKLTGKVTAQFGDLTLAEALKQLLPAVNYVLQQLPARADNSVPKFSLRVHSMAGAPLRPGSTNLPLTVPVLDALIAADDAAEAQDRAEGEPDPDTEEEERDAKLEASRLESDGAFGAQVSVADLLEYLDDASPEVRLAAVNALAERPMKVALGPLAGALGDDAASVRNAALEALGRATDRESLTKVGELAQKHGDIGVRVNALRVIARRADPASVPALRMMLRDRDTTVREAATQMLSEFERRARDNDASSKPR